MGFTGAHVLYTFDVFILALYLLSHGCALLKYTCKQNVLGDKVERAAISVSNKIMGGDTKYLPQCDFFIIDDVPKTLFNKCTYLTTRFGGEDSEN